MNDLFNAQAPREIDLLGWKALDGMKNFGELNHFQFVETQAMPRCRA